MTYNGRMTWKPTYLTREQMEKRRLEGGRLLKAGKLSQAEIARHRRARIHTSKKVKEYLAKHPEIKVEL